MNYHDYGPCRLWLKILGVVEHILSNNRSIDVEVGGDEIPGWLDSRAAMMHSHNDNIPLCEQAIRSHVLDLATAIMSMVGMLCHASNDIYGPTFSPCNKAEVHTHGFLGGVWVTGRMATRRLNFPVCLLI